MLFFWCGFLSLIVSILNLSSGYNERLYLSEQDKIIKENIYVDYLTVNADMLSELCSDSEIGCKPGSDLPANLSAQLEKKLSNYSKNIFNPHFCISSNKKIIVYTTNHFNINRHKNSSLVELSDLGNEYRNCSIPSRGIAVVKDLKDK